MNIILTFILNTDALVIISSFELDKKVAENLLLLFLFFNFDSKIIAKVKRYFLVRC